MTTTVARTLSALLIAGACIAASPAHSQEYPTRPVRIVVPFSTGGALDVIGRAIAQQLSESTGQSFVVENKAGASGNIGSQLVAMSPPDGYTLLITSFTTAAISSALQKGAVGYTLGTQLKPVATIGRLPIVLIASNAAQPGSYQDFLAEAKAKPGTVTFGSAGNGSIEHVTGELFRREAKVDLLHVPYKGGGPAMTDLLAGQIKIMFASGGTAANAIKSGKARTLAMASGSRSAAFDGIPTLQELGLKDFDVSVVYGLLGPAGLPAGVISRLQSEMAKALQHPDLLTRLGQQSVEVLISSPEKSMDYLQSDMKKWGAVIEEAKLAPN